MKQVQQPQLQTSIHSNIEYKFKGSIESFSIFYGSPQSSFSPLSSKGKLCIYCKIFWKNHLCKNDTNCGYPLWGLANAQVDRTVYHLMAKVWRACDQLSLLKMDQLPQTIFSYLVCLAYYWSLPFEQLCWN